MHPTLTACLSEIFGEAPVRDNMRTLFWQGGDRAAHFDTAALSTVPEEQVARAWCAMEDIHPESGIFFLVPGSHKLRMQWMDAVFDEEPALAPALDALAGRRDGSWPVVHKLFWPRLCAKVSAAVAAMPKVTFPLRKGDVLLFSPNATHGTMPRTDPALGRKALINEYRARSARIYFCSERFGTRRRIDDDRYSLAADHGAVETVWGLVHSSCDRNVQALLPPRP